MSLWNQGDTVVDYITLTDGAGNVITGASWSTIDAIDPDGEVFAVSVSEVDTGVYQTSFTASKSGRYYWSIKTTNISPNQSYEEDFSVSTPGSATTGVVESNAIEGTELSELVRMLAVRMGDFKRIKATEAGAADGTSFRDEIRLTAIPSDGLIGSELLFMAPSVSANYHQTAMVTGFSEDSQTLTLSPALTNQVMTADDAWLVNLHSEGHYLLDYIDAINNAIWRSYPNHLVPLTYIPTDDSDVFIPWDPNEPWLTLPTALKKIASVEAYQSDDEQHAFMIPMSPQNRSFSSGWWYDFGTKRLVINEGYRGSIDGFVIRIRGYGRPAKLVNYTDTTSVDAEWITEMAAEELKLAKGDQRQLASASMQRNNADNIRGKMVTITIPGTLDLGN